MIIGGVPLFFLYAFAAFGAQGVEEETYWGRIFEILFDFSNSNGFATTLTGLVFVLGAGLALYGIIAAVGDGVQTWRSR
jgi:hypothetical protein